LPDRISRDPVYGSGAERIRSVGYEPTVKVESSTWVESACRAIAENFCVGGGARGWVLITKDKNIRKRPLELNAFRRSGVRAFVLTASNLTGDEQARVLGEALPAMLRLLKRRRDSFIARVTADSNVQVIDVYRYSDDGPV
jgi:PIN like domain